MSCSKCLINEMVRILIEKPTILISWVARIFWKVQLQGNPFYVDLFYFSNKVNHWLMDCWVLALQKINDHHNKKKQKFVHDSTFYFILYHHEVYKLHMVADDSTHMHHHFLYRQDLRHNACPFKLGHHLGVYTCKKENNICLEWYYWIRRRSFIQEISYNHANFLQSC